MGVGILIVTPPSLLLPKGRGREKLGYYFPSSPEGGVSSLPPYFLPLWGGGIQRSLQTDGGLDRLNFCLPFSSLGRWRGVPASPSLIFLPPPDPHQGGIPLGPTVPHPSSRGRLPAVPRSRSPAPPPSRPSAPPLGAAGNDGPWTHFLLQWKSECHFSNGTQRVRFLDRDFYDRQEIDYYDSDLGKYVAVTPLGQPIADQWNSDKAFMQYKKAQVDRFCRHNYETAKTGQMVGRRAKPTVSISPTKLDPASPNTILLCIARGFYPVKIEIRWLKNGRPEEEGVAFGDELQNGDWTYQLQVMLETQPQWGDVYACQVEHASLEAPITVQWEPRSSNSARSKLWTGIVAAVIGVIFFAMGLSLYLKSKKAIPIQPPAALMN
ncbi:H-2 class II histocompatibility antigen E-S beta chain-like [Crotalus adamanteus]|uniref:H-2 class II histocompatibility antigen E-S beta chain-like n=1 Tax=Crotalus adamanteus TaxID=8729 RepID=A0AAW1BSW0_CROAD